MQKPYNAINFYFVSNYELEFSYHIGKPYAPTYRPYAYFYLCEAYGDKIISGYIGHTSDRDDYHQNIGGTYDYFTRYNKGEKVCLTFDNRNFYFISEIFPSKPLLFKLAKLSLRETVSILPGSIDAIPVASMEHPVHFEDLSGKQFERMIMAYLSNLRGWEKLNWLGETGADNGCDIWGIKDGVNHCYQCANYRTLPLEKISQDIMKLKHASILPDRLVIACGGQVTNNTRTAIVRLANEAGIRQTDVWSGCELEEKLRLEAPDVLSRFFRVQSTK